MDTWYKAALKAFHISLIFTTDMAGLKYKAKKKSTKAHHLALYGVSSGLRCKLLIHMLVSKIITFKEINQSVTLG